MGQSVREVVELRRSIRAFQDKPVEPKILCELLEGAVLAPSGGNIQAWRFGIVTDPGLLCQLASFSPGLNGDPPCLLVLCMDREDAYRKGGELGRDTMAVMDLCCAAENLMLLAAEKGLGTCLVRSFQQNVVRTILGLPETVSPELLLAVGYPDEKALSGKRPLRKSAAEVSFHNWWGGGSA